MSTKKTIQNASSILIKLMQKFNNLDITVTNDGKCAKAIQKRIRTAKKEFEQSIKGS